MKLQDVEYDQQLTTIRQSLDSSEERFRLLVEQVTEYAILLLDLSGRVTSWNLGAARIKGYRADEILGQHFSRFYRPADRWKCAGELEAATRDGRFEDEGWRVRKDGSLFWANVVITALHDSSGRPIGFAKVTRDASERRRAEEALRQSEERFRLLIESVKDYAMFVLDPRGIVATWNSGAERIKGYRAEEIIGQHFSRFYRAEDVRAGKCEMELECAMREGSCEDEGWRVRKDGSLFWAKLVITALRDPTGQVIGFAKVTRDLTERHAAEEERLRLDQLARTQLHQLAILSQALAGARSIEDVGRVVINEGATFVHADTCTLHLQDEHSRALELIAQRGVHPVIVEQIQHITRASGNPTYAIGVGESAAVWVETHAQFRAFFPALALLSAEGPRVLAFLCAPLVAEGRTIGMIAVGFYAERQFTEDEREFVRTFTQACAQALTRARRLQTERVATALADRLRASLSTTLRSIGDALIATDARGTITMMNEVAESLTGWRESEARGRALPEVFRIINEHTRVPVANPVEKVLESGSMVGLANHTLLIARDGREVPIDDNAAPIHAESGDVEGVVLVFRDITQRKRDELRRSFLADATVALAESLDYEATVARVARLAVPRYADWCAVDLIVEGERTPKRLAVAHIDPAKVELANQRDATYPPDPNATQGLPNVLRTGRAELYHEISDAHLAAGCLDAEHLRLTQELGLVSAMVVPLITQGRVLGAMTFAIAESARLYDDADLCFAEELAQRCANAIENSRAYSAERQARRTADIANRAKDEFLAVVSHELRTPLNAILGWGGVLKLGPSDEARLNRAHETIERNAVAMAQLIEDLLDTSRVISGKLHIDLQQVDLAQIIDTAIESFRPMAAAKGIELAVVLDTTIPATMGDPTRLQQVVSNLLSNALKFTAKAGRVDIALRRLASSLEITVSDNGKGIKPEFLPNVFDAFRQEDVGPSRYHGGLGLGLAITRQLVELHGGQVVAHSEGEGRGATFSVTLPISALAPATELSAPQARLLRAESVFDRPQHIVGLRILVVDDEQDSCDLVSAILQDCGCKVTMAGNVEDAMRSFSESIPDVVLSDIGMPGESGYDLIRQIRARPRDQGGDVPAAALSAYARPEDRRHILNAGYSIHIPKPVEAAELVAVVATLSRFMQWH